LEKVNVKSAKLTVFEMPTLNKVEKKRLIKWLRDTANEIEKQDDLLVYVKNPRWTLFRTFTGKF